MILPGAQPRRQIQPVEMHQNHSEPRGEHCASWQRQPGWHVGGLPCKVLQQGPRLHSRTARRAARIAASNQSRLRSDGASPMRWNRGKISSSAVVYEHLGRRWSGQNHRLNGAAIDSAGGRDVYACALQSMTHRSPSIIDLVRYSLLRGRRLHNQRHAHILIALL